MLRPKKKIQLFLRHILEKTDEAGRFFFFFFFHQKTDEATFFFLASGKTCVKKIDIFLILLKKIDCGYALKLHHP